MAPFASILCAVDGSRASAAAVHRAIAVAGPDGAITFLAIVWRDGVGPTERAALAPARAEEALRDAAALAAAAHVPCECVLEHAPDAAPAILRHARSHSLLVLGAPPCSRAAGVLSGSVASAVIHRAPVPVLLARGPREATKFPRHIVVASDGSHKAQRAVDATAELARAGRARVTLAYVDDGSHAGLLPPRVAEHAELLRERMGVNPDVAIVNGRAEPAIAAVATRLNADLIVVGSRGLRGVRALASISERVAHDAPVSVLIARKPELAFDPELTAAARAEANRARERAFAERFAGPRVAIRAPVS